MKSKRLAIKLFAWTWLVCLSAPMIAFAEDDLALNLRKGEMAPHDGVLLPESEYIFLEASNEEKKACLKQISKLDTVHLDAPKLVPQAKDRFWFYLIGAGMGAGAVLFLKDQPFLAMASVGVIAIFTF